MEKETYHEKDYEQSWNTECFNKIVFPPFRCRLQEIANTTQSNLKIKILTYEREEKRNAAPEKNTIIFETPCKCCGEAILVATGIIRW